MIIKVLCSALLGGTAEFQGKAKIKFEAETGEYLPSSLEWLMMKYPNVISFMER
jgi:hypothetical protein